MTDRQLDQMTKENKAKMRQTEKAAMTNKNPKSKTSPLVRKPSGKK